MERYSVLRRVRQKVSCSERLDREVSGVEEFAHRRDRTVDLTFYLIHTVMIVKEFLAFVDSSLACRLKLLRDYSKEEIKSASEQDCQI